MKSDDLQQILQRIDKLDSRIESFFHSLATFCLRTGNPLPDESAPQSTKKPPQNQPVAFDTQNVPIRQIQIGYDKQHNKLIYDPEYWGYTTDQKIQWVSKEGKFDITVNRQATQYARILSPFDGQETVTSTKDKNDDVWKTPPIRITSVFTPAQRRMRSAAMEKPLKLNYIVHLDRNGQTIVDQSQFGDGC